jgi:hypothetical protein
MAVLKLGLSVFPLRPSLKRRKPIDAAPGSRPRRGLSRGSSRPDPELPLIGVKRPEIRFLHENSKNIPAGSNPSKRHLADRAIVVPSDQERKTGPITAIQIKAIPGRWIPREVRAQVGARPSKVRSPLSRALSSGRDFALRAERIWNYRHMD